MTELFPDLSAVSRHALDIKIALAELLPANTRKYISIDGKMVTVEQAKQLREEYDAHQRTRDPRHG